MELVLVLSCHIYFYISVIQSISTECSIQVWSLLLINGSTEIVRDDGRHMYLEKFDQNGELIRSKRLRYKAPRCLFATLLDGYIAGSSPFVSSVF